MDEGEGNVAVVPPPAARRGSSRVFLAIAVAIIIVVAGAVAAAAAVPVFSLSAGRSLGQMLPSSTVFYGSVDLNPSGAKRDNWNHITHAFTDQPAWKQIASTYDQEKNTTKNTGTCVTQTGAQINDNLSRLGHTSALALIGTTGLTSKSLSNLDATTPALKRNAVFLASLDVKMTIFQAVSGFSIHLQSQATSYKGVSIYQQSFSSCGTATGGAAQSVYAALDKGYVVLGLSLDPIKRIIDVAAGNAPNLASVPAYQHLSSQISSNWLAGYYLDGTAARKLGLLDTLKSSYGGSFPTVVYANVLKSSVAGVYADPDGLLFESATPGSGTSSTVQPAGQIATQLADNVLALFSLRDARSALNTLTANLGSSGLSSSKTTVDPIVNDITAHLSGELDIEFSHPNGALNFSTSANSINMPASLLWQVNDDAAAEQDLADLVHRVDANDTFRTATASDGTTYHVADKDYGYAVRKGWAIVSLKVSKTVEELASIPGAPLSSVPAMRRASPAGSTAGSLWYLNAHDLRIALEKSLLPSVGSTLSSPYREYIRPFLAPINSISGTTAVSADGQYAVGTLFIGIAAPGS